MRFNIYHVPNIALIHEKSQVYRTNRRDSGSKSKTGMQNLDVYGIKIAEAASKKNSTLAHSG